MDKIKPRLQNFSFIINAVVFASGAWAMFEKDAYYQSGILFLASIINLILFKNVKLRSNFTAIIALQILNSLTAFLTAFSYYSEGSNYIHVLWIATGLINLIIIPFIIKKTKRKQNL